MSILDGKLVRSERKTKLIEALKQLSFSPCLAIVQVGDRPDSTAFINAKRKFAAEIGVKEIHIHLPENISQEKIVAEISKLNKDKNINGIIVQLPLPAHLERSTVINTIDPKKDVDGLTAVNVARWVNTETSAIWPATARGIGELFDFYKINLAGKRVVVVGRSMLVGKPIAAMCLKRNATITICHSKTTDLATVTREADVLIVAAGKPKLITKEHVKVGQIVVDVGISARAADEAGISGMIGDVDFETVAPIVKMISPVPGGVGQMTVLALFENLFDASAI